VRVSFEAIEAIDAKLDTTFQSTIKILLSL
jgi:hypothetical protein